MQKGTLLILRSPNKRIKALCLLPLAALLAACSSEPSIENMREAIQSHPQASSAVKSQLLFEKPKQGEPNDIDKRVVRFFETVTIEKINCSSANNGGGSVCDFRWGRNDKELARTFKARFFESDRGWAMEVMP